jgi:hypothetical protein
LRRTNDVASVSIGSYGRLALVKDGEFSLY